MKIAVCHGDAHPPSAGIGYFAYNISQSLADSGYEFHLFLRGDISYEQKVDDNLVVHWCPYLKLYPFNNHIHRYFVDRRLQRLKNKIDLLHLHSPISPPLKTDLPTVATVHTPLQHKREIAPTEKLTDYLHHAQTLVSRRIERHIIEKSQIVTTVSESVRSHLAEGILDEGDIVITPNGVDTSEFDPNKESRDGLQLLYTGRLVPVKGLPDLLQAVSQIDFPDENWQVVITGKGEYVELLQKKATELDIENHVNLVGFVPRDRLVTLYETSDVFVFPTYYEGLPTSVLEAMAAGLPTVSTTAPGVRDLLDHEETGLLGSPGDVDQLTTNIQRLLDDEKLRHELGRTARQQVEDKYDWQIVSQQLKSVYQQAVKNPETT